ncbi:MAG: hypothetical protein IJU26_02435 [Synergistaceae bacterium]|nr:hypothetical protein [Synergistaceae bacterium]
MKSKLCLSFAVLMMILLNAGADLASAVTVRGHDGSELALSQIPDIIRHVTGRTSGISSSTRTRYTFSARIHKMRTTTKNT